MEKSSIAPRYAVPRGGYAFPQRWKYNEYRVEGEIAYLRLCDRRGALVAWARLDAEDLDRVLAAAYWTLHKTKTAGLVYASGVARGVGTPIGRRKPRLFLHRLVMDAPTGTEVDHEDGDGIDCRKRNLRITDHIGNNNNRRQQRRERQLEDALRRLLDCTHAGADCPCRAYARELAA